MCHSNYWPLPGYRIATLSKKKKRIRGRGDSTQFPACSRNNSLNGGNLPRNKRTRGDTLQSGTSRPGDHLQLTSEYLARAAEEVTRDTAQWATQSATAAISAAGVPPVPGKWQPAQKQTAGIAEVPPIPGKWQSARSRQQGESNSPHQGRAIFKQAEVPKPRGSGTQDRERQQSATVVVQTWAKWYSTNSNNNNSRGPQAWRQFFRTNKK